jgi:hypothetical protein
MSLRKRGREGDYGRRSTRTRRDSTTSSQTSVGESSGQAQLGGLTREAHIVARCIRKEEGYSYAELVDRVSLMPTVCDRLGLHPDAPPDPTTFCHSFDRYAMYIWQALLRISA